uniref:Uncharacterized protein n=2 Tax=Ixodes scapularis TaxID=6945 RepID=A0A1S4KZI1_IXOSC
TRRKHNGHTPRFQCAQYVRNPRETGFSESPTAEPRRKRMKEEERGRDLGGNPHQWQSRPHNYADGQCTSFVRLGGTKTSQAAARATSRPSPVPTQTTR